MEKMSKDQLQAMLRRDLVLGSETRQPKALIAQRVASINKIFEDKEKWRGHLYDWQILQSFYLPNHCNGRLKPFCERFHLPRWKARQVIRNAILFFNSLQTNEGQK